MRATRRRSRRTSPRARAAARTRRRVARFDRRSFQASRRGPSASSSLARAASSRRRRGVSPLDLSECAARRKASTSFSAKARRSVAISSRASSANVSISSPTNGPPIVAVEPLDPVRSIARHPGGNLLVRPSAQRLSRALAGSVLRRSPSAPRARPHPSARTALERGDQLLHPDRLRHVVVHSRRHAQLAIALHGVGRHGDDPRATHVGPAPVDLAGGLEAVHLRHLHVHQNHVVRLPLDGVDRLEPVGRHVGAVAHLAEQPRAPASG